MQGLLTFRGEVYICSSESAGSISQIHAALEIVTITVMDYVASASLSHSLSDRHRALICLCLL